MQAREDGPSIKARSHRCRAEDLPCDSAKQCPGKLAHCEKKTLKMFLDIAPVEAARSTTLWSSAKAGVGSSAIWCVGQGVEAARARTSPSVLVLLPQNMARCSTPSCCGLVACLGSPPWRPVHRPAILHRQHHSRLPAVFTAANPSTLESASCRLHFVATGPSKYSSQ